MIDMTSKEQIIKAARKVFERFGFNKASMGDIATASRKGRRTIYTHFSGKEEVFRAVIDTEVQKLADKLRVLISQEISPKEKLRQYMQTRMNDLRELTIYYDALRRDIVSDINYMEDIRKEYDRMEVEMLKAILDEGNALDEFDIADTFLVSEAIVLAAKGFELPIFLGRSDYDHNRLINPLIDLLFEGIKKRTGSSSTKQQ